MHFKNKVRRILRSEIVELSAFIFKKKNNQSITFLINEYMLSRFCDLQKIAAVRKTSKIKFLFLCHRTTIGPKIQRNRIHTKSFISWRRAIVKNMAEMRATPGAEHFGPMHVKRIVVTINNAGFSYSFKKTWPSTGTCKFRIRPEKFITTNSAIISAFRIFVPVFSGKSRLGGCFPCNSI